MHYNCIYCDIDGTVADSSHRVHHLDHKDWPSFYRECGNDPVIEEVAEIIRVLSASWYIVFCTGRPEWLRSVTIDWFERNNIPYDELYMRADDDHRPDTEVKTEMLQKMRDAEWHPMVAFEDRKGVTEALRKTGLRVLQVCEGDY